MYKARLGDSMPLARDPVTGALSANNGSYFSLDIGPSLHLTTFNTETALDTADVDTNQTLWLLGDLGLARAGDANRTWVLAGAHRPLYCTNDGGKGSDCGTFASLLRSQVEGVFAQTKTDMVFAAHMHGFERTYPVNNGTVVGTNFTNPGAPVYVVNGAAGNREGNENPNGNMPWSVPGAHYGDIGFGLMTLVGGGPAGSNSLTYEFVRSADGAVLDTVVLGK
jgi:acid phosphatase type 7